MAVIQQDVVPRDITFDAEKCIELEVIHKLRYFEKQKTRTFAKFWEQWETGRDTKVE